MLCYNERKDEGINLLILIFRKKGSNMKSSKKDIIEANRKYNEKNYDRITLNVLKGDRELIRQHVEETYPGLSVNQFIKAKIREEIPNLR